MLPSCSLPFSTQPPPNPPPMSPPLQHDYITLSDASSAVGDGRSALNLKETELRLGPPGSDSPDRADLNKPPGLTLDLLPGKTTFVSGAKRGFSDAIDGTGSWVFSNSVGSDVDQAKNGALFSPREGAAAAVKDAAAPGQEKKAQVAPAAKAQVVGWPPIRSYRKNTMATTPAKNKEDAESKQAIGCLYVKVSMDGAPYLRKVDLKIYCNYKELSTALEKMFSGFTMGQCGGQGIPSRDGMSESCLMDLLNGSEYVLTYEDKDGDWMLVGDVPWAMFTNSCRRLRIMKGSDAIGLAPRAMEKCKNRN